MKTELTGLDLRKAACEALGWEGIDYGDTFLLHAYGCPNKGRRSVFSDCDVNGRCTILSDDLLAIESDPTVSEKLFLEWCEKNEMWWRLAYRREFAVIESIRSYAYELWVGRPSEQWQAFGSTPSEARARAIVAATAKA